jgi:Kef-type K+ transport system membrane component KefB
MAVAGGIPFVWAAGAEQVPQFLGLLALMLFAARVLGGLVQRAGQPAVLGELLAGVLLGPSVVGQLYPPLAVNPETEVMQVLSELGVLILLFEIGLETDLKDLLRVGGAATVVAVVGVALPFVLGYAVCRAVGLGGLPAVVAGAALTATSVGITARVLSDLGRLQGPEGRIILGAAVLDDVIGLVILTVVGGIKPGEQVTVSFPAVARDTAMAFGFLIATLLLGRFVVPRLLWLARALGRPGAATIAAVVLALALAWLADRVGSAVIIGAFAAGLLLGRTRQAEEVQRGVAHLGHFFVPLFFVTVGAEVDVRVLNPLAPGNGRALLVGGLLTVAAVLGKFLAGYAPFWFKGRKSVVGVGMVPRGEVGLIFARRGLHTGVFDAGLFSAVTLMVMVTTFLAPPLLRWLCPPRPPEPPAPKPEGVEELVTGP